MSKQIMDGCTAATYVAYALSDVATIYPISPVASMGETAEKWSLAGRKNYLGVPMHVVELESELGAAGATHGALAAGALATTFTNSQGLLLMIPNMYKMAGNQVPAVFHVGTRALATHALSIFGDHADIMATRATGFAFLGSSTVQETMDLALVAHLAAVEGSIPVVHFFDGERTANETATIDAIDYADMFKLINWQKIAEFRQRALNPEHPSLRGSAQNPDVFFQNAEAQNTSYAAFPAIVQQKMDEVAALTGRAYHLFDYYGAPDAEAVIVTMASSCEVVSETIDQLNATGYKVGLVKVRLFRPFSGKDLMAAIPASVKSVITLDRTKENGADGEPLYKDVATAVLKSGRNIKVLGGRYGLASKDFTPAMVKAIYDNAQSANPINSFTVGIVDDVTHLSLPVDSHFEIRDPQTFEAVFYGMGSDGTVGATHQAAAIIGATPGFYTQAFFHYSAKKSGGYTISQLRFGPNPIHAEYTIREADYLCFNKDTYVTRFSLNNRLRQGGTFVLNCSWTDQQLDQILPDAFKRDLATKKARFYVVDAQSIAQKVNLGVRINVIMEAIFFHFVNAINYQDAITQLKQLVTSTYMHEGDDVVQRNIQAIDMAISGLREVAIPDEWSNIVIDNSTKKSFKSQLDGILDTKTFFDEISDPCLRLEGDELPVSAFSPDGRMPMGTTAFEKRRIAIDVPQWDFQKCIECTQCSLVCPHAAIRPYLLNADEMAKAPTDMSTKPGEHNQALTDLKFRIQVYTEDCTGCSSCATICPGHALTMVPKESQMPAQIPYLNFLEATVSEKNNLVPRFTIIGSQLNQPLLEFSGACAGCGETPYVKLLTQLFGERMIIANATGCSSIWGANYPSNAYCVRKTDGRGPAWGNSLFEDNAEYGYGMALSQRQRREALAEAMRESLAMASVSNDIKSAMQQWLSVMTLPDESQKAGEAVVKLIEATDPASRPAQFNLILANADMLGKKSIWAIGGDGWAYDIGFAGLDHVLASGEDINILVLDTECYSNTGGHTSKATPLGACMKYTPNGKRTFKKDLGRMMMTYGTVYVASVALGANYQQVIDAMREAEAYPGPSIIIAYCPCISHGIRTGMGDSIVEERKAVEAGYWPIYRFNPMLALQNLSPYIQDAVQQTKEEAATAHTTDNDLPIGTSPSAIEANDQKQLLDNIWHRVAIENAHLTVDYPLPAPQPTPATSQRSGTTQPIANSTGLNATQANSAQPDAPLFPEETLNEFLDNEDRYADIRLTAPTDADRLRASLSQHTNLAHSQLDGLSHLL